MTSRKLSTLLDLAYLLCLHFLQPYSLLTKPSLLTLPALASITPNMAFPCSQEVCLQFLMLLGFAYFNILTLILSHRRIYMQHGQNCTKQQNSEIGYGRTNGQTNGRTDGQTE